MSIKARALSVTVRLAQPMWRVVEPSLAGRFVQRNAWNEYVPAFLNAVSTVGAFGHELAKLRQEFEAMRVRVESIQRELRVGSLSSQLNGNGYSERHAVTVNRDKVERVRDSGLRVNVGCGHLPLDGYVNVDPRELPGVDVLSTADNLPFETQTVHELFSAHLLDHFPQEQLRRHLLPYWRGLLVRGGLFRAVVASNRFTPEGLGRLLAEAGFNDVQLPEEQRIGQSYEFEIRALG